MHSESVAKQQIDDDGEGSLVTDIRAKNQRIQTVCLLILAAIAIGFAMFWLRPVLVPFVLALFFTYVLTPVIDLQMKYLRLPRGLAITATAVLGCIILAAIGTLIATSVTRLTHNLPQYQHQLSLALDQLRERVPLAQWGLHTEGTPEDSVRSLLSAVINSSMTVLSNGVLVVVFMVFMLTGHRPQKAVGGLGSEIERSVKRYLLLMGMFSALTGLLVGSSLMMLGVQFAYVFGFLAFVLNFIPSIGSIIATLLPLPVVLLDPELSMLAKVLAIGLPALIQFSIGSLVQPKVQGDALQLHPVTILLALIFFGTLWGVVGAFLATPITAVTRIILNKLSVTRPIADVMAGRLDFDELTRDSA
jgi:AI-2 transport protein TqsA